MCVCTRVVSAVSDLLGTYCRVAHVLYQPSASCLEHSASSFLVRQFFNGTAFSFFIFIWGTDSSVRAISLINSI